MLELALLFGVLAAISWFLAREGTSALAPATARKLFWVFLAAALVALLLGLLTGGPPRQVPPG